MDLHAYLRERRELLEAAIERVLPPATDPPQRLHESVRYSVMAPGKRLRPVLVMASAEAAGGSCETVLPTACALECIHAFSLIHDDLPCMDDDDTRRGLPTNHMVFGEAMALLAGDALLALAFELVASNAATVAPDRVVAAVAMVARASGTWGMVGGQVMDIESEGRPVTGDCLRQIHARKTGALIGVSSVVGALLVGADDAQIARLEEYGSRAGLAFQIADDILDIVGDEDKIGKPVGSDQKQDKATYPKVFGLDRSLAMAREEVAAAVAAIEPLGPAAEPLRAIAHYIVERDL